MSSMLLGGQSTTIRHIPLEQWPLEEDFSGKTKAKLQIHYLEWQNTRMGSRYFSTLETSITMDTNVRLKISIILKMEVRLLGINTMPKEVIKERK